MKLWTWQNPGFNITNPNTLVNSKRYSEYFNSEYNTIANNNYLKAYEVLWSILKTNQFHWYYTDKKEATSNCSIMEYNGKLLWEIDIPNNKIFKKMCCMAWHWILNNTNASPPKIFENFINLYWWPNRTTFNKDCNKYWRDIGSKKLWDCLFHDCGIKQCYQVLVQHPINEIWVIKNPLKDRNWWMI
jgi:hypothetical protein